MPSGITKEWLPFIICNATTKLKWQIKTLQNICQHFAIIQCLIGTSIFHCLCFHTKLPFYNPLNIKHFPFFLKFGLKPWVSTMPTPDLCKKLWLFNYTILRKIFSLTMRLCDVSTKLHLTSPSNYSLKLSKIIISDPINLCFWTNTVLAKNKKLAPKSLGPITLYHSTVMQK